MFIARDTKKIQLTENKKTIRRCEWFFVSEKSIN